MPVVQFVPRDSRQMQVVTHLREALALAEADEIDGYIGCRRYRDGRETVVIAGCFESNQADALHAWMNTGMVLNDISGQSG